MTGSTSLSTSLGENRGKTPLETAHQAQMDGDFATAEATYRSAYSNQDLEDNRRALALFGLAETYAAPTNPKKDFGQALALYQTLLVEFPASELRLRAERRVKEVRELIGRSQETE